MIQKIIPDILENNEKFIDVLRLEKVLFDSISLLCPQIEKILHPQIEKIHITPNDTLGIESIIVEHGSTTVSRESIYDENILSKEN